MSTAATATTSSLAMSPLNDSPSPTSHKRKRSLGSPFSTRTSSPASSIMDGEDDNDGDDDDEGNSSSTTTTATSASSRSTLKSKSKGKMDPARVARLEARAARNRVSAQHSRDRKKNHVVNLEVEVTQLRAEKAEMTTRIKALEDLVKTLLNATGANKGNVEQVTTDSTPFSPSSLPKAVDATSSSLLCITPQALSQRTTDSTSFAAPISSSVIVSPASSLSTLPNALMITPKDLTISDARLPAVEATRCERCKEAGNRKQATDKTAEPINGRSNEGGDVALWAESASGEQGEQVVSSQGSCGEGTGEESSNWLAQYLEGMLESSTDYQENTHSSTGEDGEAQQDKQSAGTLAQAGQIDVRQDDVTPTFNSGEETLLPSNDFDLEALLSVDQYVDIDMDIQDDSGEGLPLLEVIRRECGLGHEINV
ncbi:hypothetical protein CBS101457_005599 [Exobasidium rhododendri]|nr:hypothetical protein CBS101457_005599 [Exobasidium rhododendri]